MSEREKESEFIEQGVAEFKVLPGAELQARREQLGWTVDEAADRMKMTSRQIEALEADDFDALPGLAVTRGFVRAYAKAMQMDAEPLVAMLQPDEPETKKKKTSRATRPAAKSTIYYESRMPTLGGRSATSKKWLIGIISVAVLIAALMLCKRMGWLPDFSKLPMLKKETPAKVEKATKPGEKPAVVADKKPVQEEKTIPEGMVQKALPPIEPVQVLPAIDGTTVKQLQAQAKAAPADNVLILRCQEQSWYEFRRPDGLVLKSGLLQAGASKSFTVDQPMQLTLGNGPAVEATLGGKPLEIKPRAGKKIVKLNLK